MIALYVAKFIVMIVGLKNKVGFMILKCCLLFFLQRIITLETAVVALTSVDGVDMLEPKLNILQFCEPKR